MHDWMDDAPTVRVSKSERRVARLTTHVCAICRKPIAKGDTYIRLFAIVDGVVETQKRHTTARCALMLHDEDLRDAE